MKVTVARIRLYLKEGKTLSDGSNPIMVMVSFNGRKEKANELYVEGWYSNGFGNVVGSFS